MELTIQLLEPFLPMAVAGFLYDHDYVMEEAANKTWIFRYQHNNGRRDVDEEFFALAHALSYANNKKVGGKLFLKDANRNHVSADDMVGLVTFVKSTPQTSDVLTKLINKYVWVVYPQLIAATTQALPEGTTIFDVG